MKEYKMTKPVCDCDKAHCRERRHRLKRYTRHQVRAATRNI